MSKPIRCSELGQIARCPHAVQLKYTGAVVSEDAKQRMTKGDDAHNKFNDELKSSQIGLLLQTIVIILLLSICAWLLI